MTSDPTASPPETVPPSPRWTRGRIVRRTIDVAAIAVVTVLAVSTTADLTRWWQTPVPAVGDLSPLHAELHDRWFALPDDLSRLAVTLPQSQGHHVSRHLVSGTAAAVWTESLRLSRAEPLTGPLPPPREEEAAIIAGTQLADREGQFEQSGFRFALYRVPGGYPGTVLIRTPLAADEPPADTTGADAAGAGPRLAAWTVALPDAADRWVLWMFRPGSGSGSRPDLVLPDAATPLLGWQTPDGAGMISFEFRDGTGEQWRERLEETLTAQGWRTSGWHAGETALTARMTHIEHHTRTADVALLRSGRWWRGLIHISPRPRAGKEQP